MKDFTLNRERLAECRKALGITKMEAARRMDMSQPAYLRYESGDRMPSIHVIREMARVLGTSAEYLTGETDDPKPNCCYVREDADPELFRIIELYQNGSQDIQKRMIKYLKAFQE